MTKITSPIAVLGAGSWGTALAIHLARNAQPVLLWSHDAAQIEKMQRTNSNEFYLPGIPFPDHLTVHHDLAHVLQQAADIMIAVPSHAFRSVLTTIKSHCTPSRLLWATKGIDPLSHQLLHTVCEEYFAQIPLAILSGPSFAKEVANGLPTALTVASNSKSFSHEISSRFHSKNFRVYTSDDIIGVEIGGAMKNVLGIAVGIADGLGFGANARCALITRGLAEMVRLGTALGGKQETFIGLAGIGDLVLTCTDNQSRNRRFGLALGQGIELAKAENTIGQVVEGVKTAAEIHYLAQKNSVEIPICEQVYQVIYEKLKPAFAVDNLLSREPKAESI